MDENDDFHELEDSLNDAMNRIQQLTQQVGELQKRVTALEKRPQPTTAQQPDRPART